MKRDLDVVTLGEAMVRLSPPGQKRLEQANSLDLYVGGAELSVAIGAARLGLKSAWVSKLPRNPLGSLIANLGRGLGVDVSRIVWSDAGRAGLYFLEFGASPRASSVLYDRKDSAASTLEKGEVDWSFLKSCRVFHVSGITPALSDGCREATFEAVEQAKKHGCEVCFDVNYRSKLWSPEQAESVCTPLARMADILIASDAAIIWGVEGKPEEVMRKLKKKLQVPVILSTLKVDDGVLRTKVSSIALSDKFYQSRQEYSVEVVDRLGMGDSFAAGFIFGYLKDGVQTGLDYGDAMAAYKATIPGDANYATREEIEKLISSGANLRIQR
jgi:2-dehydro-3-deoxygluconokinase